MDEVSFTVVESTDSTDGTTGRVNIESRELFEVATALTIRANTWDSSWNGADIPIRSCSLDVPYISLNSALYILKKDEEVTTDVRLHLAAPVSHLLPVAELNLVVAVYSNGGVDFIKDKQKLFNQTIQTEYTAAFAETQFGLYLAVLANRPNNSEMMILSMNENDLTLHPFRHFANLPDSFLAGDDSGFCLFPKNKCKHRLVFSIMNAQYGDAELERYPLCVDRVHEVRRAGFLTLVRSFNAIHVLDFVTDFNFCAYIDLPFIKGEILSFCMVDASGNEIADSAKILIHYLPDGKRESHKVCLSDIGGTRPHSVVAGENVTLCESSVMSDVFDYVLFLESFSRKVPDGARVRSIFENKPHIRLQTLIDRDAFDKAYEICRVYGLDPTPVTLGRIRNQISEMHDAGATSVLIDDFLKTVSVLPKTSDEAVDYAFEVLTNCRTITDIIRVVQFCLSCKPINEILMLETFVYGTESYRIIYGPNADFSSPVWPNFWHGDNHWELFVEFCSDGRIREARVLWQRYKATMTDRFQSELDGFFARFIQDLENIIRRNLSLWNEIADFLQMEILPSFVSQDNIMALVQYTTALSTFLKTVAIMLDNAQHECPFSAHYVLSVWKRFVDKSLADATEKDQSAIRKQLAQLGVGSVKPDDSLYILDQVTAQFEHMCRIQTDYRISLRYSDYCSASRNDLAQKLIHVLCMKAPDNSELLIHTRLQAFCNEHNLDKDRCLLEFVMNEQAPLPSRVEIARLIETARYAVLAVRHIVVTTNLACTDAAFNLLAHVMEKGLTKNERRMLELLDARCKMCTILTPYNVPRSHIMSRVNVDLLDVCGSVIFSKARTMKEKYEDFKRLTSLSTMDDKHRVTLDDVVQFVTQLITDPADLTSFLDCVENKELGTAEQHVLGIVNAAAAGPDYLEGLNDELNDFLSRTGYQGPEQFYGNALVILARFGVRALPEQIGCFEAARPLLMDILLDPNVCRPFSDYLNIASVLQLDVNQACALLFEDQVYENMKNAGLVAKFQDYVGSCLATDFVLKPTDPVLPRVVPHLFNLLANASELPLTVDDLINCHVLVRRISDCCRRIFKHCHTSAPEYGFDVLLVYSNLVRNFVEATLPPQKLDLVDAEANQRKAAAYGDLTLVSAAAEKLHDTKCLQLLLQVAGTFQNSVRAEPGVLKIWTDLVNYLFSANCPKLTLDVYGLSNCSDLVLDNSFLSDNFLEYLHSQVGNLCENTNPFDEHTAHLLCMTAADRDKVRMMLDSLFREFYKRTVHSAALNVHTLMLRLGFLDMADSQRKINAIEVLGLLAQNGVCISSRNIPAGPMENMDRLVATLVNPEVLVQWATKFKHNSDEVIVEYICRVTETGLSQPSERRLQVLCDSFCILNGDMDEAVERLLMVLDKHVSPYDYEQIDLYLRECCRLSSNVETIQRLEIKLQLLTLLKRHPRQFSVCKDEKLWILAKFNRELEGDTSRLPFHLLVSGDARAAKSVLDNEITMDSIQDWEEASLRLRTVLPCNKVFFTCAAINKVITEIVECEKQWTPFVLQSLETQLFKSDCLLKLKKLSIALVGLPRCNLVEELTAKIVFWFEKNRAAFEGQAVPAEANVGDEYTKLLKYYHQLYDEFRTYNLLKQYGFYNKDTHNMMADQVCTYIFDNLVDWNQPHRICDALEFVSKLEEKNMIYMKETLHAYVDNWLSHVISNQCEGGNLLLDQTDTLDLTMNMGDDDQIQSAANDKIEYNSAEVTKVALLMALSFTKNEISALVTRVVSKPQNHVKLLLVLLKAAVNCNLDIFDDIEKALSVASLESLIARAGLRCSLDMFKTAKRDVLIHKHLLSETASSQTESEGMLVLLSNVALDLIPTGMTVSQLSPFIRRLLEAKLLNNARVLLAAFMDYHKMCNDPEMASMMCRLMMAALDYWRNTYIAKGRIEPRSEAWNSICECAKVAIMCPTDSTSKFASLISNLKRLGMEKIAEDIEVAAGGRRD